MQAGGIAFVQRKRIMRIQRLKQERECFRMFGHNYRFPGYACPKINEISLILDIINCLCCLYIQILLLYRCFLDILIIFNQNISKVCPCRPDIPICFHILLLYGLMYCFLVTVQLAAIPRYRGRAVQVSPCKRKAIPRQSGAKLRFLQFACMLTKLQNSLEFFFCK